MNNIELVEFFQHINEQTNYFDRIEALKKLNKQYKKSSFYKNTKMPIMKAYGIFQAQGLLNLCQFLNSPVAQSLFKGDTLLLRIQLQEFLLNFDTTCLEPIFAAVEERLSELADINGFDMVHNLQTTLEEFLKNIKK